MQFLNSYYSHENNATMVSVSYQSGANNLTGTLSVAGDVTAETQEQQVAKAQQTILSIIDPTATILQLQNQSTTLQDDTAELQALAESNRLTQERVSDLTQVLVGNVLIPNDDKLWPGQYADMVRFLPDVEEGKTYVHGQVFKYPDESQRGGFVAVRVDTSNIQGDTVTYNGENLLERNVYDLGYDVRGYDKYTRTLE